MLNLQFTDGDFGMKRLVMLSLVSLALTASSGCCLFDRLGGCHNGYPVSQGAGAPCGTPGCNSCGLAGRRHSGAGPISRIHGDGITAQQSGPPQGAIAYPYYTPRGPRDFLATDPRGIGPGY